MTSDWQADTSSNIRRLRELKGNIPHPQAERIGEVARKIGRPLSQREIDAVNSGEADAVIEKVLRARTPVKDRVGELEATVRLLTERLDAVEQAQKSSTPIHLAKVERR